MGNSLIIVRDFNVVLNYDLDKLNRKQDTNLKYFWKVNELLERFEIHDIWRTLYSSKTIYLSFQSYHTNPLPVRLFLTFRRSIRHSLLLSNLAIDHPCVSLEAEVFNSIRDPDLFRINISVYSIQNINNSYIIYKISNNNKNTTPNIRGN